MFIQTEETPNPNALKFLPGQIITEDPIFFHDVDKAKVLSPLAIELFNIHASIVAVFFGKDFITITKAEEMGWENLKGEILMLLMDYLQAEKPIFFSETPQEESYKLEDLSEIEKQIVEIIETRVRPSVAMDGGDIIYHGFKEGIVYLKLRGACSSCPSATITLKNGIENMLHHFIPEVIAVEAVE